MKLLKIVLFTFLSGKTVKGISYEDETKWYIRPFNQVTIHKVLKLELIFDKNS